MLAWLNRVQQWSRCRRLFPLPGGATAAISYRLRLRLPVGLIMAIGAIRPNRLLDHLDRSWLAFRHVCGRTFAIATIDIRRRAAFVPTVIVVVIIILIVAIILVRTTAILFLEARTVFVQHPKIVIRELEIIFAHHPIALHLGIARERLVFLGQLAGIAAGAVVDPVAAIIAAGVRAIGSWSASATAATVILTIIYQRPDVLVLVVI